MNIKYNIKNDLSSNIALVESDQKKTYTNFGPQSISNVNVQNNNESSQKQNVIYKTPKSISTDANDGNQLNTFKQSLKNNVLLGDQKGKTFHSNFSVFQGTQNKEITSQKSLNIGLANGNESSIKKEHQDDEMSQQMSSNNFQSNNSKIQQKQQNAHQYAASSQQKKIHISQPSSTSSSTLPSPSLCVTIHSVSIQIPPSINLIVQCIYNEKKFDTQKKVKVDSTTKLANFLEQELIIPMQSYCIGGQSFRENHQVTVKLLAVNETKQKLIGLIQLKVNVKDFKVIEKESFIFDKCIDKQGSITLSAQLNTKKILSSQFNSQSSQGGIVDNSIQFNASAVTPNNNNNQGGASCYQQYVAGSRNGMISSNSYSGGVLDQSKKSQSVIPFNNESAIEKSQLSSNNISISSKFMRIVSHRSEKSQQPIIISQQALISKNEILQHQQQLQNDDDECNLINKDDFDEGKCKDIVTARATPIKHNALAKKNLTTNRKPLTDMQLQKQGSIYSPNSLQKGLPYHDTANTQNNFYQIITQNQIDPLNFDQILNSGGLTSQTQRVINEEQAQRSIGKPHSPLINLNSDALETQRRNNLNCKTFMSSFTNQPTTSKAENAGNNSSSTKQNPLQYLRSTPVKSNRQSQVKKQVQKPPQTPSSFQQICEQIYNLRLGSLQFSSDSRQQKDQEKEKEREKSGQVQSNIDIPPPDYIFSSNSNVDFSNLSQQNQLVIQWKRKAKLNEEQNIQLKSEIEGVRREKQFIQDKCKQMQDDYEEQLKKERDHIKKLLLDREQIEADLKFLQKQQEESSKPGQRVASPQTLDEHSSSTKSESNNINSVQNNLESKEENNELQHISEEIVFKYNKAKQQLEFFEKKYSEVQEELEGCKNQISNNFKQLQVKDQEVERQERIARELEDKMRHQEKQFQQDKEELNRRKKDLQKEVDFLMNESNQKELELCDLKDKLKKKDEELKEIKLSLNSQIASVYEQYHTQIEELKASNSKYKIDQELLEQKYTEENRDRIKASEEKIEALERLERIRDQMISKDKELIESQSEVANFEEKLLIIEQQLITAKASWANAEHEREQMYNRMQELEEKVQELETLNLELKKDQHRGRRDASSVTTKTSSTIKLI